MNERRALWSGGPPCNPIRNSGGCFLNQYLRPYPGFALDRRFALDRKKQVGLSTMRDGKAAGEPSSRLSRFGDISCVQSKD